MSANNNPRGKPAKYKLPPVVPHPNPDPKEYVSPTVREANTIALIASWRFNRKKRGA